MIAAALLVLLAAGAPAERRAWSEDIACPRMRELPEPHEVEIDGWHHCDCLDVDSTSRLCKCVRDTKDSYEMEMRYEREGQTLARWETGGFLGDTSRFDAWLGDLDADGDDEIVVFSHLWSLCGWGSEGFDVTALDRTSPRALARIEVEDHDDSAPFTCPPDGGPCRLLATRWANPPKGDSHWLIGRWLLLRDGRWASDDSRPTVARRYFDARFEEVPPEEADADFSAWYSSHRVRPVDPSLFDAADLR